MKIVMLLLALALSGCAYSPFGSATAGGANYSYTKNPDGSCSVTINSAREISGGNLVIGSDCTVTVTTANAGGPQAIEVIGDLVRKMK